MTLCKRIERLESANSLRDTARQIILNDLDCKHDCDTCDRTPVASAIKSILVCKTKAEVICESE